MKLLFSFLVSALLFVSSVRSQVKQETVTYADTLGMDIFWQASANNPLPVLIYVHGGGFSGGVRDSKRNIEFCKYFAERGWLVATISYHLTQKGIGFGCEVPVQNKINTFRSASNNIHQAVAYLMKNKQGLVNPDKIVLSGSSAGAEAILHAAYWKETLKDILPADFSYAGLISMAGAVIDLNWINEKTAIPSQFFHGTCDPLVPFGNASHHYCPADNSGFMMLYGPEPIVERMDQLNVPYYLVADCGGGHEWAGRPMGKDYIHYVDDFLTNNILKQLKKKTHLVLNEGERNCASSLAVCE